MDLFDRKARRLLVSLFNNQGRASSVYEASSGLMTYPHALKLTGLFEQKGLLMSQKRGRVRHLYLTDKGKQAANYFLWGENQFR